MKYIVIDMRSDRERGGTWDNYDDAQTAADEYNAEGELDREWVVVPIEVES